MKMIYKSILLVAVIAMATIFATSCKDDNDSSGGAPYISYVRITDPKSADSLLVASGQGQLIAIVGGNLQNTREIWFNDQQATSLRATYITNTSILVNMPSKIPSVVTNKMKLVFANSDSLLYDFKLTINAPVITSMNCEYVPDGGIATINGGYFYLPITVTFPGGVTASSENDEDSVTINTANNIITLKVPQGAQPGQLIIKTNFGAQISDFWFRDNRNIIEGFDNDGTYDPGTNGSIITDPGDGDPSLINGPYDRVIKPAMGGWEWTQVFARWGAPYCKIPDEAILHPDQYYYKFEVCTMKPFDANGIRAWVTDPSVQTGTPDGVYYNWMPPFDSQGKWQTVSIPFENFASALGSYFPKVLPDGSYFCAFVYCEGGTLNCDMSYDNFRIVPKTIPKPAGSDY